MELRNKDLLSEYIKMLVYDIIKDREVKQIIPCLADAKEVQHLLVYDMKDILNKLCKEGTLTFRKTLNGIAFEFTKLK